MPEYVIYPENEEDVKDAIQFAKQLNKKLSIRGTGIKKKYIQIVFSIGFKKDILQMANFFQINSFVKVLI